MVDQLRFQWDIVEAMIGGTSALDLPRLKVESIEQAESFLENYGFDVRVDEYRNELEWVRGSAVRFIENQLLVDVPGLVMPAAVRDEREVAQVLLMASAPLGGELQRWSCALLRVMHTVAHARLQLQERFGDPVRAQILSRFEPHLQVGHGETHLGYGELAIPIHKFEVKHAKPLESVVLKLLHKPENVAADIFDHLGLRFVTYERLDVLLVARYLRQYIVSFPNIKPSRSKNTLLDMAWVRREVEALQADYPDAGPAERLQRARERVRNAPYPGPPAPLNPHSAVDYHAIQFTCRHYVRLPDPFGSRAELCFFFPYEVQIFDRKSFEDSRSGLAGHEEYKRRQRDKVRLRVLGPG